MSVNETKKSSKVNLISVALKHDGHRGPVMRLQDLPSQGCWFKSHQPNSRFGND